MSGTGKSIEKVRSWLPKPGGQGAWDQENGRVVSKGYMTSFGDHENVRKSAVVVVVAQLCN